MLRTFMISSLLLLGACSSPEPADQYEAAVFNPQRPSQDTKQDAKRQPAAVLRYLAIKPGMTIADIKGGDGYYAELFNHLVAPEGKVYLHNFPSYIDKHSEALDQRMDNHRLANVQLVTGNTNDFNLPEPVDLIFLSQVFHDLYLQLDSLHDRALRSNFFNQLKVNLKPDGKVVVIDHAAPAGSEHYLTGKLHRIDAKYVEQQFVDNGFEMVSSSNILANPDDPLKVDIWDSQVKGKTHRFIFVFQIKKDPIPEG